jgi:hypothetical protein
MMDLFVAVKEDKYQAVNKPLNTINKGISFIRIGRMNIDWLTGGSQEIILPVQMDNIAKSSMGVIIFMCSSVLISGALELELHIVTNLNRIE